MIESIQRYWGSDDEDLDSDVKLKSKVSDAEISATKYQAPKMKMKLNANKDTIQGDEIVENNVCGKRKKRKKHSKQHQLNISETDIVQSKQSTNSLSSSDKKRKFEQMSAMEEHDEILDSKSESQPSLQTESFEHKKHNSVKCSNGIKKSKKKKNNHEELEQVAENESNVENDKVKVIGNFLTIGQVKKPSDSQFRRILPNWLSNPNIINVDLNEHETPIEELSYLDDTTIKNLKSYGVQYLFPVQMAVIPWLIQSKVKQFFIKPSDLCVSAPTGSGKTLAFVLPIVQSLKDRVVCAVRALVVLPVSELAIQIYKVFETFVRGTSLKVVLLTGQKSFEAEQSLLVKSGVRDTQSLVDIIVTTPGRILDHIHRTKDFCLHRLQYLVIDEADRMMEEIQQGWLKQIEESVFGGGPKNSCVCFTVSNQRTFLEPTTACSFSLITKPLQKLLFSATLSHDPEKLHSLSLYRPKLFTSANASETEEWIGKCTIPESLKVFQAVCNNEVKPMVICHLIKKHGFNKVLCFTETVERAHRLQLVLSQMGHLKVREISSSLRPVQRKIVLEQFNAKKVNILVSSDIVARGIDIEDIDCVISYDVPRFVKTYVHRIGRTARAGKSGTAIILLSKNEIPGFEKMLEPAKLEIPDKMIIDSKDLSKYVNSFRQALRIADEKMRKEKSDNQKQRTSTNKKKKHKKT